jgi:5'-nucleotidase
MIRDCPVVQALCCGQAVAVGEIVYDTRECTVVTRRAHVVSRLDGAKSAALDSLVAHYQAMIGEEAGRVVARLAQPMTRQPSSTGEMVLGDLIADAQRAATGAQIAMMNAGGIRAGLPEGEVTWEMLYAVQPFGNTLVLLEMTGSQVLEALEQGVSRSGRVVQVSGLTFSFDREAPAGARVKQVSLEDGKPLSVTEAYTVVVNDFMWWGGDRFTVFQEALKAEDTYTIDVSAFEDYIASLPQPVRYELQNRIRLSGD